jgi:hypothetical protein
MVIPAGFARTDRQTATVQVLRNTRLTHSLASYYKKAGKSHKPPVRRIPNMGLPRSVKITLTSSLGLEDYIA